MAIEPLRNISGTNAIERSIVRQTQDGIVVSVVSGMAQASRQAERNLTATIQEFGKALGADRLRRRLGPANRDLAEGARNAMANAYDRRQNLRENNNYRVGKGYNQRKSGMLAPALANASAMTSGTSERQISFVDPQFLSKEAPHWARLNFGAGPAGEGTDPREFTLRVEGAGMSPTNLIVIGARKTGNADMLMPKGVWIVPGSTDTMMKGRGTRVPRGGGSDDWFRPNAGAKANIPTRGVAGSNFVDAGFQYLARNTLPRYWAEFLEQAKSARSTLKVKGVEADATFRYSSR